MESDILRQHSLALSHWRPKKPFKPHRSQYAVVWMVSTRLLISKSSSLLTNPLVTLPSVPTTIGITVTFMLQFFQISCKVLVFISLFAFLQFYPVVCRPGKVHYSANCLFVLLIITKSGCLAEIRWSVYISKSETIWCISFSRTDSGLCIYHLFV